MVNLKKWRRYLPIIGLILFIYILIKIDITNVIGEIKQVNLYFLLLSLISIVIMLIVQTYKWHIIALKQNIKIPFVESFKINLIGNFYGLITPSKLGSIIRADYLKKYTEKGNIGKGLFNFIIDKVLDISSVIFMVILFSFVFRDKLELPISFFTALFLFFTLVTLFFMKKDRSRLVLRFFYKKIMRKNIEDKARVTFDSFYENIPKKRYFILFFLLNIISWIFIYLISYFIGLSVGIELGFLFYLAILPVGTLVAMIPISVGGLGTREAALISLFAVFGVSASKVFSMSIINYLIVGIIPSLVTMFLIWRKQL